uniref:PiggyBac transposable element-derived protein domain-containing protein n=1 Tax=Sexangularia sp. CB-2014 TaxID=1486929 RepID=A0A7S1VFP7_9EUKA
MCCAGWGKSISFVDEHGVQGEGAMGKDEFNAMLSKIGQHRQNEDSKVGSRYFWYVLMNDLNRFWCAQFALGGEHHSLIAVDDDKMKANMKAGWKAGLKLHVLPDKSKKNSRGFVLITGALVCTGLPLVVEAEQQNATTHQTYWQVLSRLSNNRTVGDPDLSRIVLASDRYFSNWTIVEGAVKCGAHWLGTVKRSRTTPFTFGSHVYDGQRDVEQHGPSTIYARQYPMAVNKDLRLKAMAERTGVKSGAVSMLWTTLQELPPLAFDYRVGSVDLAMWKRALPNGVIYHRVGSDRVDVVRYFFPMPLDEGHPQERGDRFTQFPHLVAALPVVHLCLEQRHAGWFILRQFRLTSTTVQLLFHEYRGAREYADFERVFSLFYRDGAVDRPTVPRDRQDGSAVDGKFDAASIPQVIGKVEEEEPEEPEGVVAGMDVVNESAEAGQDELPTSESFDLTDDAQVQLLTTEEGRKKLTKEQLSSLNRQLGLEERRPGDLPKLYKDWALAPKERRPYVVLSREELKMLPDVHTVLNRLETWKSVNSMVPLPRASQFVPLMASVWDVAKGGSDSLSQLLSGVNFHLHTAHPATAVVRRLLMIHAAAYHRFLGMSRALAKTKKVDSLIQFRTAVNRQGPFATTLLRVSDQLLRLNSSGSAEVSRLRAVRETRATGTLYYLRGVPDMRRHADESTHETDLLPCQINEEA